MSKNKRLTKQLRRFGVNVELRLDTDTCFIDAPLRETSWMKT